MTQSKGNFPNSLSSSQLQELMTNAQQEGTSAFEDQTVEQAFTLLESVKDDVSNQMVAKTMILMQLTSLMMWADENLNSAKEAGDVESACDFRSMRDRIFHVHRSFCDIQVHQEDFTVDSEE